MQENRSSAEQLVYLPLDKVYIHPLNVRKVRDEQKIAELKESIKSLGRIDEPITVIPDLNGKYGVIKGSRRYTALKELVNERWAPSGSGIPCIIRQMDDFEAHQVSAIENIQRDDLQPFEEAEFYASQLTLYPDKYPTQKALAANLGVPEMRVSDMLHFMTLSSDLRRRVHKNFSTKERDHSKYLTINQALLIARTFENKRVQEKVGSSKLREDMLRLADTMYRLNQKDSERAAADYVARLFGSKMKVRHHGKRPRKKVKSARKKGHTLRINVDSKAMRRIKRIAAESNSSIEETVLRFVKLAISEH